MATKPTKPVPMCCVSIGYRSYLMSADAGMKLVGLLQHAVECDAKFEREYVYVVGEQPNVELSLVKPGQIRMPAADPSQPARTTVAIPSTPKLLPR